MAQDEARTVDIGEAGKTADSRPLIIRSSPGGFGRFGNWLFAGVVAAAMIGIGAYSSYQSYYTPANMPQEKYHSLDKQATRKVAIIDISGAIISTEDGYVKRQIERVRDDPEVVAVVARINSPGGTVTGSDFIYHHLRELVEDRALPLVVSMGSVCASGGYYAAMAVGDRPDSIFAEPTTWTGSIGVIIPHYDLSTTMLAFGVKDDSIASGPYKQMGSPTRQMSSEERELLQALVDESFARFKEIVISGRPKFKAHPDALAAVTTGQIFTANQALEHGLVDKIGFIEAAIERAAELAGVKPAEVRCVKYEQPPTLMGELVGVTAPAAPRGQIDLAAVLDLLTPRAYYLWTWLPAALSNSH